MIAPDAMGTLTTAGDVAVVKLSGELDLAATEPLRPTLDRAALHDGKLVVLDLSDVRYIDSCGVRLLFDLRRRMLPGARLVAVVPRASFIRKVVDLVGLPSVVPVFETLQEATRD